MKVIICGVSKGLPLEVIEKLGNLGVTDVHVVPDFDPLCLDKIDAVTAVATDPGNAFATDYLLGMANGLILARSIVRDVPCNYLERTDKDGAHPVGADPATSDAIRSARDEAEAALTRQAKAMQDDERRCRARLNPDVSTRGHRVGDMVRHPIHKIGKVVKIHNGHAVVLFEGATMVQFIGATMDDLELIASDRAQKAEAESKAAENDEPEEPFCILAVDFGHDGVRVTATTGYAGFTKDRNLQFVVGVFTPDQIDQCREAAFLREEPREEPAEVLSRDARFDPLEAASSMLEDVNTDDVVAVTLVGITSMGAVRIYGSESNGQSLNMLAQAVKTLDGTLGVEDEGPEGDTAVDRKDLARAIAHALNYHGLDAKLDMPDYRIADMLVDEVHRHLDS